MVAIAWGIGGARLSMGSAGFASTWANEAECYRPDWTEMALAHLERDEVRGAYNSALYLTPRRRMLQTWADFVMGMVKGSALENKTPLASKPSDAVLSPMA